MWATYVKKRIRGLFVGDVVDRIFVFVEILPRAHTSAQQLRRAAKLGCVNCKTVLVTHVLVELLPNPYFNGHMRSVTHPINQTSGTDSGLTHEERHPERLAPSSTN